MLRRLMCRIIGHTPNARWSLRWKCERCGTVLEVGDGEKSQRD